MSETYNYRNLGAAIVLQAVKDYFDPKERFGKKATIRKHLKAPGLVALSDGLSLVAAEELKKNPKAIAERLGKEETQNVDV
jgi:hypothetical protein